MWGDYHLRELALTSAASRATSPTTPSSCADAGPDANSPSGGQRPEAIAFLAVRTLVLLVKGRLLPRG